MRPEGHQVTPAQQQLRKRRWGLMKTERLRRRKGRRSAGPSHRLRWDAVKMGVRTEKDAVRIDEIMFH